MNKSIHIRLTDEEHKKLADLAQMANLSITAYIKSIAFDNKANPKKEYDIFRVRQDQEYISEFDKQTEKYFKGE